jgi:hypothetical protein
MLASVVEFNKFMLIKELRIQKNSKKGRMCLAELSLSLLHPETPGLIMMAWIAVRRLLVHIERPLDNLSR